MYRFTFWDSLYWSFNRQKGGRGSDDYGSKVLALCTWRTENCTYITNQLVAPDSSNRPMSCFRQQPIKFFSGELKVYISSQCVCIVQSVCVWSWRKSWLFPNTLWSELLKLQTQHMPSALASTEEAATHQSISAFDQGLPPQTRSLMAEERFQPGSLLCNCALDRTSF